MTYPQVAVAAGNQHGCPGLSTARRGIWLSTVGQLGGNVPEHQHAGLNGKPIVFLLLNLLLRETRARADGIAYLVGDKDTAEDNHRHVYFFAAIRAAIGFCCVRTVMPAAIFDLAYNSFDFWIESLAFGVDKFGKSAGILAAFAQHGLTGIFGTESTDSSGTVIAQSDGLRIGMVLTFQSGRLPNTI